jgi:hypothetical protein
VGPGTLEQGSQISQAVRGDADVVQGACSYCANAYGVKDDIESGDVDLIDEFDGHPSVHKLVSNGYQVLTF